jgi:hypothetical protein
MSCMCLHPCVHPCMCTVAYIQTVVVRADIISGVPQVFYKVHIVGFLGIMVFSAIHYSSFAVFVIPGERRSSLLVAAGSADSKSKAAAPFGRHATAVGEMNASGKGS